MSQPVTRHECIDHLRRAALGIRAHIQNPKVIAMHTKADDGYLVDQERRAVVFDWLADFYEAKEAEARRAAE